MTTAKGMPQDGLAVANPCWPLLEVVSVGNGNGQGLRSWAPSVRGGDRPRPYTMPPHDADHESADSEKEAAGAEGNVERHDFIPRCWWIVMGAMRRDGSLPARTGSPCRPSQMLLWPANRSRIWVPRTGMVVRVSPHWLAKTIGNAEIHRDLRRNRTRKRADMAQAASAARPESRSAKSGQAADTTARSMRSR